jgi:hypothetical protein
MGTISLISTIVEGRSPFHLRPEFNLFLQSEIVHASSLYIGGGKIPLVYLIGTFSKTSFVRVVNHLPEFFVPIIPIDAKLLYCHIRSHSSLYLHGSRHTFMDGRIAIGIGAVRSLFSLPSHYLDHNRNETHLLFEFGGLFGMF